MLFVLVSLVAVCFAGEKYPVTRKINGGISLNVFPFLSAAHLAGTAARLR
jgi:hypothetical protein